MYEIISKPGCVFCDKARNQLTELKLPFIEQKLGADLSKNELLERVPEAKTVPQVFLDNEHIGGWTELAQHLKGLGLINSA